MHANPSRGLLVSGPSASCRTPRKNRHAKSELGLTGRRSICARIVLQRRLPLRAPAVPSQCARACWARITPLPRLAPRAHSGGRSDMNRNHPHRAGKNRQVSRKILSARRQSRGRRPLGSADVTQSFAGFERTCFSSASSASRIEASSSLSTSPRSCGRCSSLSICLRLRSMKDRHSGAVIVSKFSEKRSTVLAVITTPRKGGFQKCISLQRIMPNEIASAKQITNECESRRGQDCAIPARHSWRVRNFYCRYAELNSATSCRKQPLGEFPFELCKGDLSIRLFSSTGCGVRAVESTTFSAGKGRS